MCDKMAKHSKAEEEKIHTIYMADHNDGGSRSGLLVNQCVNASCQLSCDETEDRLPPPPLLGWNRPGGGGSASARGGKEHFRWQHGKMGGLGGGGIIGTRCGEGRGNPPNLKQPRCISNPPIYKEPFRDFRPDTHLQATPTYKQ